MNLSRAAHRLSGGTGTRARPSPSDHSSMAAKLERHPREHDPVHGDGELGVEAAVREVVGHRSGRDRDQHDEQQQHQVQEQQRPGDDRDVGQSAWWLTQMMPIVKKLIRYADVAGPLVRQLVRERPVRRGPSTARSSASRVMATANTPSLNASSLPRSIWLLGPAPVTPGRRPAPRPACGGR